MRMRLSAAIETACRVLDYRYGEGEEVGVTFKEQASRVLSEHKDLIILLENALESFIDRLDYEDRMDL